jgi:cytochrome c-type biogenesis protein CcmH/NrfG
MKISDQEIRQAVDHRLSALDDDPSRRARILRRIEKEGEPQVKKKLSVGLVFAIVLLLILAGVALALSTNLLLLRQRDKDTKKWPDQARWRPPRRDCNGWRRPSGRGARFDSAFYDA